MRDGRPSTTAAFVSFFRGLASLPSMPIGGVHDPVARELVPGPFALGLRAAARVPVLAPALRLVSLGLLDHVSLRTAAIDDALRAALAQGCEQLVLLGAGLDARAYRMAELVGARVFEVDHPATQAHKRARARSLEPRAREVVFVEVDFERDSLARKLEEAGHDARRPTVWIWEGVTPYLPPLAIRASLAVVAARSASASTLLVTYVTPELAEAPFLPRGAVHLGFRVLGEPLRGGTPPRAMRALLDDQGFDVLEDSGSAEWAERYLDGPRRGVTIAERLAVARRR